MTFTTSKKSEQLWKDVQGLKEFHAEDLVQFGVHITTARNYINRWETMGLIVLIRRDRKRRFAHANRPIQPIQPVDDKPTPEGNMWRAMRRLQQFSPTDLAAHSNAGGVEVSIEKARSYCRALLAIGYVKVRQTAIPGKREPLYQLIENTGPRAPYHARVAGIVDENTSTFHPTDRRFSA